MQSSSLSSSSVSASNRNTTARALFDALVQADSARDLGEIARLSLLLLVYGHVGSLGSLEDQFRRKRLATHLIACEFVRDRVPPYAVSRSPIHAPEHQCAYYVSFNVEGPASAANERRAQGSDSADENVGRLRADCGFLVHETPHKHATALANAMRRFGGHVQAADAHACELASKLPFCIVCRRTVTQSVELRVLTCCPQALLCSSTCWESHVAEKHSRSNVRANKKATSTRRLKPSAGSLDDLDEVTSSDEDDGDDDDDDDSSEDQ